MSQKLFQVSFHSVVNYRPPGGAARTRNYQFHGVGFFLKFRIFVLKVKNSLNMKAKMKKNRIILFNLNLSR